MNNNLCNLFHAKFALDCNNNLNNNTKNFNNNFNFNNNICDVLNKYRMLKHTFIYIHICVYI